MLRIYRNLREFVQVPNELLPSFASEIMGTPIRIQFQNSENPFEAKTDKLTISPGTNRSV
ncbi:hypothetical protein O9992_12800 [Vibrio lentus]|nr:hypothetical protein [Vibrio lentus]